MITTATIASNPIGLKFAFTVAYRLVEALDACMVSNPQFSCFNIVT